MPSEQNAALVMLGPDSDARGGIASVLRVWQDAGLFGGRQVTLLATYVDGSALRKLGALGRALLRFVGLLLGGQVGAVHAHSASNASFRRKSLFLALARLAGKPYVFHLHGGAFDRYHAGCSALERAWVRRTLRGARIVFVLSDSWAEWLHREVGHPDIRVLPNPVLPVRLPAGIPREPQTLLFLGRLEADKGIFVLLGALARLRASHPGLRAVLAGEGDLPAVSQAAAAAGVADLIELPGWVAGDTKARCLARAGVFVLPSRFEGLPMALLEAQAAGLPVVASRVGGIPQVVSDGENGVLHAPDDEVDLARALATVLDDAEGARRLGSVGQARVLAGFGIDRVRSLLEEAWQCLDAQTGHKEEHA
ncbi:glycosyltransferase family 4 protein [Zoogloea sp.]|uniref:glycosyltransferase family 4 protein n=1 Tax=Zoogloea sp. TaxID=49181 RepID=UPI0014163218|nr:MAG: glycosyltransferase family 4 protein [Zoogloea sp.]